MECPTIVKLQGGDEAADWTCAQLSESHQVHLDIKETDDTQNESICPRLGARPLNSILHVGYSRIEKIHRAWGGQRILACRRSCRLGVSFALAGVPKLCPTKERHVRDSSELRVYEGRLTWRCKMCGFMVGQGWMEVDTCFRDFHCSAR